MMARSVRAALRTPSGDVERRFMPGPVRIRAGGAAWRITALHDAEIRSEGDPPPPAV